MAETRKLAAILAADVVGYSKLAGADEERTLARSRARHRRARRHLSLGGRLSAGEVAARSRRQRSRRNSTQEHRRAGPGLCPRSRQGDKGEAYQTPCSKAVANARSAGRGDHRTHRDCGRRLVFGRAATSDRHLECTDYAGRGRASFHRGVALHEPLRRTKSGLLRRRRHGEPHDRPLAHPQQLRDCAQYCLHPSRAGTSTVRRSARNWACAMSSKVQCSATRTECASTCNLSMGRPAPICGPTGSRRASPICSSCRIRSWHGARGLSRQLPRAPSPALGTSSIRPSWRESSSDPWPAGSDRAAFRGRESSAP